MKSKLQVNADYNVKYATLGLEIKSMKHIVCETEERCDKLEALFTEIDRNLHHTMQLVADMENYLSTQQRLTSIVNTRGELMSCECDKQYVRMWSKELHTLWRVYSFCNFFNLIL